MIMKYYAYNIYIYIMTADQVLYSQGENLHDIHKFYVSVPLACLISAPEAMKRRVQMGEVVGLV